MLKKDITINSRKYDGTVHRTWKANLIEQNNSFLLFFGKFEKTIKHPTLGVIGRGTISYEYYWLNHWFNIFRFHDPDGKFRNFYCNINMPPIFENNILDYVDLDLDILVWKDFSYEILDEDEFEENSKAYGYSQKLLDKIHKSKNELINLIKSREFPFSMTKIKY